MDTFVMLLANKKVCSKLHKEMSDLVSHKIVCSNALVKVNPVPPG